MSIFLLNFLFLNLNPSNPRLTIMMDFFLLQMICSSYIFVFWFLVFWSLQLRDVLNVFFHLAHLALQNVYKDFLIFSYFCNFVTKRDKKLQTKNGMNETKIAMFQRIGGRNSFPINCSSFDYFDTYILVVTCGLFG